MARRYGAPHKLDKFPDGRSQSGPTSIGGVARVGYSGYVRASYCRAYVLTFDQAEVLQDWK